jgi:ABC-type nitrate/sulfonate/bicarbonate transport system substrate-binding protein
MRVIRFAKFYGTIAAAAILAAGLAGCGGGTNEIRVCLDWTPNTNHTGLYAAQSEGYFAREGLKVSILEPPPDGALPLLAAGKAEFAVDFQETMGPAIAKKSGALPVEAVAAIISHNTSGLMSLKKSGITRPRDLEGKRVDAWGDPLEEKIEQTLVQDDGGDPAKVTFLPDASTDAFSALQSGTDAVWVYYAWEGMEALEKGAEINYLDIGKLNRAFDWYTPVLVTNTAYAKAHPQRVRAFLRALSAGYAFAAKAPDKAAEILLKAAPELDASLVKQSQNYLASRYRSDAPKWGWIDGKRWDAFYEWMYNSGLLETSLRDKGYTNEYLP